MPTITNNYIERLPQIYKDVLRAFALFNPRHKLDDAVAVQSLYSGLGDKYLLAQVRVACEKMAAAGVVEIKDEIFVKPSPLGKRLIEQLTEQDKERLGVPDFPPLDLQPQEA